MVSLPASAVDDVAIVAAEEAVIAVGAMSKSRPLWPERSSFAVIAVELDWPLPPTREFVVYGCPEMVVVAKRSRPDEYAGGGNRPGRVRIGAVGCR